MADTKVSALAAASALDGSELLPVVQGGQTKQISSKALVGTAATPTLLPAINAWVMDPATATSTVQQSEAEMSVILRHLAAASYDVVALNVTGAGSTGAVFRVVFYSVVDGAPGSLIASSAAIDATTTGVKQVTLSSALVVPPSGLVFGGVVVQGTATTRPTFTRATLTSLPNRTAAVPTDFSSVSVPNYYTSSVSSTPPSTWTATNRFDSSPRFAYRRSA